jgi:pimeloyl-ACP methyl ester carboxylesterase
MWALWYALAHPDRIKRLVLLGPPAVPKTRCPLPIRLAATPGVGELLSRLAPPSPKSVLQFAHHAAREKVTLARYPDLVDLLVAGGRDPIADRVARAEFRVFVSPFALLSPSGVRRRSRVRPDELRQLAMPTLVIWGEQDPLGSVSVAQAATELIPHARLVVLPTGHGPWLGQPAQTAATVADFVR